jgi:hypothetical protein
MSCELLFESKKVRDTTIQIMIKMNDTTIAKAEWII